MKLVLNHATEEWKRPPREWFEAKTQFAVVFSERFVSQGQNRPQAQNSRQSRRQYAVGKLPTSAKPP